MGGSSGMWALLGGQGEHFGDFFVYLVRHTQTFLGSARLL